MNTPKVNLLNFDHAKLREFFVELGEKPFRATQLLQWIHYQGIASFEEIPNFSKALRQKLSEIAEIKAPEIIHEQFSRDGTRKWLQRLDCGNAIESVFIPQGKRGTLCISSQVGCALNCSFCSTGKQGFNRNLTLAEMIGQVWNAARLLSCQNGKHDRAVTNVVLMGMGEPLLNFDTVVSAMDLMMDDMTYSLSKYRITLSTSGIVPEMMRLAERSPVALAVSLHAPNDELRNQLVPINKKYPLEQLMAACRAFYKNEPRRHITFEYVMLDGVNDRKQEALQLIELLKGVPAKVNLIPFNPFPGTEYKTSARKTILAFRDLLMKAGIPAIIRLTRGEDIDAACGQLVGNVYEKTKRQQEWHLSLQNERL